MVGTRKRFVDVGSGSAGGGIGVGGDVTVVTAPRRKQRTCVSCFVFRVFIFY